MRLEEVHQRNVVLVSGPSGVGKNTLIKHVLASLPGCHLGISITSRPPRIGEKDGVDYHFVSRDQFETMVKQNQFAEYENYDGNYYGTPLSALEPATRGQRVLLELEVKGAKTLMQLFPKAPSIFIVPPDPIFETLRRRLAGRGMREDQIVRRIAIAKVELPEASRFKHRMLNRELSQGKQDFLQIVCREFGVATTL